VSTPAKVGPIDWFFGLFRSDSKENAAPARYDGLENAFLGYGTSRDKLTHGAFVHGRALTDHELDALYYGDDIAAKIVNARPEEMLRRGYRLTSKNDTAAQTLQEAGEKLALDEKVLRSMQWGGLRGGALLVPGTLDGSQNMAAPLNEGAIKETRFLNVIDRRHVSVFTYQENPNLPGLGEPELYMIGNVKVHASRVIRFDGVEETDPFTRRNLGGWTYSVLQRPYEVIRDFATGFKSAGQLVADCSQGVWKIQDLLSNIATDRNAVITRMAFADMTRSAGRAIMLDAELEDFQRVATPLTGLDSVLELFMMRLAAAADMPVTLLMGRSPAGMNATGDADFRAWYGKIATEQENRLKPKLLRAYRMIGGPSTPGDLDVEFRPLWEPTEKEKAETDKVRADTFAIYIDKGVVLPEQVAIAAFGSGEGKLEIDEKALRKALSLEQKFSAELEKARSGLSDKELAALSIAQGVSPIIVSALINSAGKEGADREQPQPEGPANDGDEEPEKK
jgi:uncharacterized protein